jgi:hypothetical protein
MAQELRETLRLEQVAKLRDQTEKVSQFLFGRLKGHLESLRPLLAPARVFGKHIRGPAREDVPGSEIALQKLCEQYNSICTRPFSLPSDLADSAVVDLDGRLELYAWEYNHEAKDASSEVRTITISSPVKSVLTYKSAYTLSQMRLAVAGKGDRRQDDLQEFLVAALAMQTVLDKFPGITRLLTDLRYNIRLETCPGLGELPLVVISSNVPAFRPSDEILLATTQLSGVPAFIELIDVESIHQMADPLKPRLEELLR